MSPPDGAGPKDVTDAGGFANGELKPYRPAGADGAPIAPLARFLSEVGAEIGEPDVLACEPPPRDFLLARRTPNGAVGWLPSGEIAMLAAGGGVGKTTLACQLSLAVATGRPFCGMPVIGAGSVLLALAEEDEREIRRKLHWTSRAMELDGAERARAAHRIAILPLVGRSARLLQGERRTFEPSDLHRSIQSFMAARATDWRLVVLDPFSRFCAPEAETDNAVASETVRTMAALTTAPGRPVVLILHHVNKDARDKGPPNVNAVRGAGALTDEARWAAVMWPDDKDPMTVRLAVRKSNYAQPGPTLTLRRTRGGVLRPATLAEEDPGRPDD